jgi:hypothetical protein
MICNLPAFVEATTGSSDIDYSLLMNIATTFSTQITENSIEFPSFMISKKFSAQW